MEHEKLRELVKDRVREEIKKAAAPPQINESLSGTLARIYAWAGLSMIAVTSAVNIGFIVGGMAANPVLLAGFTAVGAIVGMFAFNVSMSGAQGFEIQELRSRIESINQIASERDAVLMQLSKNKTDRLEKSYLRLTERMRREGVALDRFVKKHGNSIRSGMVDTANKNSGEKYYKELVAFAETVVQGAYTQDRRLATHEVK